MEIRCSDTIILFNNKPSMSNEYKPSMTKFFMELQGRCDQEILYFRFKQILQYSQLYTLWKEIVNLIAV